MKKCILCGASKVHKYYEGTNTQYKCNCIGDINTYYSISIGYYILVNNYNIIKQIDIGFDDIRLSCDNHVMYYKYNKYILNGYDFNNIEFKEDIDYLDKIVRRLIDNLIFM